MAFKKNIRLTILSIGVFSIACLEATDKPSWIESPPPNNDEYHYYIGRSSSAQTETSAFSEATKNAYEQAISENFGVQTKIQKQSYETATEVSETNRIQELSKDVKIDSFEKIEFWKEETKDNRHNVWILFRYSNNAIKTEKQRLLTIKDIEPTVSFSEIEGSQQGNGAVLEIITDPPGAAVYIDGAPSNLLSTPLRLTNQLSTGKHSIRIDHPSFQSILEEVIIIPKSTITIEKILVKAMGKLKVVTDPPHANIVISGKHVGLSPTDEIPVTAGVPVLVEVTHSEAEKASQEVTVEKDSIRTLEVKLLEKPRIFTSSDEVSILYEEYTGYYKRVENALLHLQEHVDLFTKLKRDEEVSWKEAMKLGDKKYSKKYIKNEQFANYADLRIAALQNQLKEKMKRTLDTLPDSGWIQSFDNSIQFTGANSQDNKHKLNKMNSIHKRSAPNVCFNSKKQTISNNQHCLKKLKDCSERFGSENKGLYYYFVDGNLSLEKKGFNWTSYQADWEDKKQFQYVDYYDRENIAFCRLAAYLGASFEPDVVFHVSEAPWKQFSHVSDKFFGDDQSLIAVCIDKRPSPKLYEALNELAKKWHKWGNPFSAWKSQWDFNHQRCASRIGKMLCTKTYKLSDELVINYLDGNCSQKQATWVDLDNRIADVRGPLRSVITNPDATILQYQTLLDRLKLCQRAYDSGYRWEYIPTNQLDVKECHEF